MTNLSSNTVALIKLAASPYDMYDHANYGKRFNKNNPKPKSLNIFVNRISDTGKEVQAKLEQPEGLPKWVTNKNAPEWSKLQTHIYPMPKSVSGTGHGDAYCPQHSNPYKLGDLD